MPARPDPKNKAAIDESEENEERDERADADAKEIAALRSAVIADIARVAAALEDAAANGLSLRQYLEHAGPYSGRTVRKLGTWQSLCEAAGVRRRAPGGQSRRPYPWQKTRCKTSMVAFEAALDRVVGRKSPPRGMLCMVGLKRRRGPQSKTKAVTRDGAALERTEIIADIREVSRSAGLLSPELLTWETYRSHGGRYTYYQILNFGGFPTLRRAA